jgi:HK97 family phage prohead protease
MNLERRVVGFELRAASDDGTVFEGYASCWHTIDTYGSIIAPGAFDDSLSFFLDKGFIGGLNHDWDQPIGKPLEASTDARGLFSKARISDTSHGRDVKVLLKDGVITQLSIGFTTQGYEWLDTQEEVAAYWEKHGYAPSAEDIARSQYGALLKTRIKLYEYSPVTIPANSLCDITDVRSALDKARETYPERLGTLASEPASPALEAARAADQEQLRQKQLHRRHSATLLQAQADLLRLS